MAMALWLWRPLAMAGHNQSGRGSWDRSPQTESRENLGVGPQKLETHADY